MTLMLANENQHPEPTLLTVVMPTYKRPERLKRAVDSIRNQTFENWTAIISDDEDPPGETWEYLQSLATEDARFRILRHMGEHGQEPNVNFALEQARSRWVKVLFDDDALLPNCLEAFMYAADKAPDAAMIVCRSQIFRNGKHIKSEPVRKTNLEHLEQKTALLAMYLQDFDFGIPSQVMIRGDLISDDTRFGEVDGIKAMPDGCWYARILTQGDLIFLNQCLIEKHYHTDGQGIDVVSEKQRDQEYNLLRSFVYDRIDPSLSPPSIDQLRDVTRLIRGIHRVYKRRFKEAATMLLKPASLTGYRIFVGWVLRRASGDRITLIPRQPVG